MAPFNSIINRIALVESVQLYGTFLLAFICIGWLCYRGIGRLAWFRDDGRQILRIAAASVPALVLSAILTLLSTMYL